MSSAANYYRNLNSEINPYLAVLNRPVVSGLIQLFFVGFAGLAAPSLAPQYAWVYDNAYFRLLVLALIAWTGSRDPTFSIALAVVFLLWLHYATDKAVEGFEGPKTA